MSALQEKFAQLAAKLIQQADALGYGVTLGEAWRTPQQAQWNADHNTGVVHSLHIERLAIDLNLFKNGNYLTTPDAYTQLGEWWEQQDPNCRWGGRFKNVDLDHYSLSPDGVRG